jgi:heptosyltransferase-3
MYRRLIVRPGAIGDFVLSIPAMRCLNTGYLEVWAASRNVPLARFANKGRSIAGAGLDLLGVTDAPAKLIEQLRGFDCIVSWYGSNRPEFRALAESQGLPFHFFPALPPEGGNTHAADYYLAQARTIAGCTDCDAVPRVECTAQGRRPAPLVLHPFSGSPKKCWPLERFRELSLRFESRMPVEWCAGPEDELPGAVRMENLYELACWLSDAKVYVGNDSGITHLAAAAGTPVVALFGPTDPAGWAPRGPRVRIVAAHSMDGISVDEVQAAVESLDA